uniref:50S ribosomal protein L31 n=1 Tax=Biddulphia biddulphiana TaxID=1158022 RepID=A0A2U9NSK8_9STRA|nr:ribosomal protein L31 [Biddulphia biddulphiana]AWT40114.1 ribosomal protein L31 [Biddulphia biddulphiana]
MPKSKIHPTWFNNAPVYCDGKPICFTGSTQQQLQVDIWLINHPFYTDSKIIVDSEGRVERFMKKYGLDSKDE